MTICRHGVNSNEASCVNCENTKRRKQSLKIRKFIAPIINLLVPVFGLPPWSVCPSCGIAQHVVPFHSVQYDEGYGSSIICEACWRDISMSEKLNIYKQRWTKVYKDRQDSWAYSWEEIEKAIQYPFYWENTTGYTLRILEVE